MNNKQALKIKGPKARRTAVLLCAIGDFRINSQPEFKVFKSVEFFRFDPFHLQSGIIQTWCSKAALMFSILTIPGW